MSTPSASRPASEYVEFWNDTLADKFNRFQDILMNGLSFHSRVPLEDLEVAPGSRILDVGCGWGDTAIQLARMTGPEGQVLGIDCVDAFLEDARRRAEKAGVTNVRFEAADVERYPFAADFDLCFSRFGMMFFEHPVPAMRNIFKALKPGGELMFIVWRDIEDNPWLGLPRQVVLDFLPPPGEEARTCGPGPFSMANPEVVRQQLESAGFVDIGFDRNDGPVEVGDSVENAMRFQLALGPAGEVFREAGEEAERQRPEIEAALRRALAPFEQGGKIVMGSSSWTVVARKPDQPRE
ncbi:class I SAM-dependent methyltransferase [Halomonas organivorans]|uniref:Ubiquinone/menaquinone biosynthesis C-methylase UbiE n=1 Tax=Halomonas organivorans TaxID=257772 RepID=A0A7W5G4X7_9GAMM|nr:class I SAM-dependent methyltransferase [Halomonas organivorans]MBB3139821.1 ubiquinone/menaquinone biosynthesis C-methylase UbiE [Halomonas organivorans]